jgi:hypothetical protein
MLAIWAYKTKKEVQALPHDLLKLTGTGCAIHIRGKLTYCLPTKYKYF